MALSVMKDVFGFENFLSEKQEEAFRTILRSRNEGQHKNVFISLKSQGGKSFCYQLQGALQKEEINRIILVISPSLVVIKKQAAYLNWLNNLHVGLRAVKINSEVIGEERKQIMIELRSAECQIRFLFVTPDMIMSGCPNVRDLINEIMFQGKISHCFIDDVTKRGDFRPNLANLSALRRINTDVPWIILTTANENAIQIMKTDLGMARNSSFTVKGSSVRNDIFYSVVTVESADAKITAIVNEIDSLKTQNDDVNPRSLIFVTFDAWKQLTSSLNVNGIRAKSLYSKLDYATRRDVQNDWFNGKFPILVTTREYFGYGNILDFPVEFVFHADSLNSRMDSFYQESGRARGPDGRPAKSFIFRVENEGMVALRNFETSDGCRHRIIEAYFDNINYDSTVDCENKCDNCEIRYQQ